MTVEACGPRADVTAETTGTSAPVTGPSTPVTGPTRSVTVETTGVSVPVTVETTAGSVPVVGPSVPVTVETPGASVLVEVATAGAAAPVAGTTGPVTVEPTGAEGAGAGVAEPAPEPMLAVAVGELVEGGEALALETAPLTVEVAWETACPTADDPVPEPPCDAPDVACAPVGTADLSTDDRPPADDPPEPVDDADAEPAVRIENPMARPIAATASPAAYRDSRRTLVTTPLATSGNLARQVDDVHVRETPQFGQMSTRSSLIPRSRPGSAHRHFHLLPPADRCARPTRFRGRAHPAAGAGRSRGRGGRSPGHRRMGWPATPSEPGRRSRSRPSS